VALFRSFYEEVLVMAREGMPGEVAAAESGRKRKYYRITKKGRAQLAAQRQQWQAVDNTLRGIWMKASTV
jgi:DNA-binding PadR family transcriptional regulator